MKSTLSVVAFAAGLAYAAPAADYGAPSSSAATTTTFACNPAHSYPNGATCISTAGSLTLVTPVSSAATTTTYACNPAHSYPNGATCISTAGSLTLVTPSASASSTCTKEQVCYAAYNQCRSNPDANFSTCGSDFSKCLGYSPFTSDGTNTVTPKACTTASATVTSAPAASGSATVDCYKKYNECRGAPDANFATCASQYATCLGYNPFANNGTNTVTPKYKPDTYVTQIVTAYTTYCPQPTTLTHGGKTYTVSSATTLTITDCPCTITTPIKSLPPASTITAILSTSTVTMPVSNLPVGKPSQTVSSPASTRSSVQYTGAAEKLHIGGAVVLGALGMLAL